MPPRPTAKCQRLFARIVVPAVSSRMVIASAIFALTFAGTASPGEEAAFGEPRLLHEPAQPVGINPRLAIAGLSPFQPAGVTSRLRRTLLQYEALVADKAWDEAIDLIEELQAEAANELAKMVADQPPEALFQDADAHERYLPVARRTQQLLASLPPEGIEIYRQRLERSARRQVDRAIANLDEISLERVVEHDAVSSASRDALLALAELSLERNDTAAARRWLQRIDPLAWDPFGRPAGITLVALDPTADTGRVAAVWAEAKRPDNLPIARASESNESLTATVLARLALASVREGHLRRAAAEIRLLQGIAPEATGRFAGRDQSLADALGELLSEQQSNPSAEPVSGFGDFAWAWSKATPLRPIPTVRFNQRNRMIRLRGNLFGQPQRVPQSVVNATTPTVKPVVESTTAYYVEVGKLKQLDLVTGETVDFKLPGTEDPPTPEGLGKANVGEIATRRFVIRNGNRQIIQFGQPAAARQQAQPLSITRLDPDLTLAGGRLFVRTTKTTRQAGNRRQLPSNEHALLGIDPRQPDEIALRLTVEDESRPDGSGYRFGGPPILRGDRLYVALTRPGVRTGIAVACYSTESARELWRTEVGAGEPANRLSGSGSIPITLAGDTVYLATEMGAIAALDSKTGSVRWIAQYPRETAVTSLGRSQPRVSPSLPCVVVGDRVIAAPADSAKLFAWDTGTGRPLWETLRSREATIAGVAASPRGAMVVLSGRQIASYDSLTGARRFAWPESDRAGLRGRGNAVVVGGEVFWPTREALYTFNPTTGVQTRPPIDLAPVGAAGANVIPTDYGLLLAGPEQIRLLASLDAVDKSEPETPLSRLMEDGEPPMTARLSEPATATLP